MQLKNRENLPAQAWLGYLKAIPLKKEQNNATCSNMDLEIVILSEISQTEKDKYHMISLICGI